MTDEDSIDESRPPWQVQSVYDQIAEHFSKTRAYAWPEVEEFVADRRGQVGLDLGCGNGRHIETLLPRVEWVIGVDLSRELLNEAGARLPAQRDVSLVQADAAALPVRTDSVDLAIYVATLHHLPDRETRVESLAELARVLDGTALISAWSTAHDRFDADPAQPVGFDTTIDWTLPGGETVPRFYHIYGQAEFDRDLEAGGLHIERSYVSSGNCYAEVRA